MSTKNLPTYVRLPPELKKQVEREAAENGRSVTGEIVYRLKKAYEGVSGGRAGSEGQKAP